MAHFHKVTNSERISEKKISVSGASMTVGLWGYIGFNASELDVKSNNTGVTTTKGSVVGNSRQWTLKGAVGQRAKISALYSDEFGTHTWDGFEIEFAAVATVSQAGQLAFASMDQCGTAALDEILSRSISEGVEFAGLIFQRGASFGFTAPRRGEPDASLPGLTVPAGTTTVGTYHTHGNKQGSGEIFSPQDRGFHNLRHWFAYLGTPSRAILKFTPKERPANEHPGLAVFGGKAERLR